MKKGFTILEVIVAIFIITVGLVGLSALVSQTISFTTISSSRLVASYLAQEGIEIVRNIRDSNWLEQRENPDLSWTEGLEAGDWEADYLTQDLTQTYAGRILNLDSSGFYSYLAGSPTQFKRQITITPEEEDILNIQVKVSWQERGRDHQVTAEENLYKWR